MGHIINKAALVILIFYMNISELHFKLQKGMFHQRESGESKVRLNRESEIWGTGKNLWG